MKITSKITNLLLSVFWLFVVVSIVSAKGGPNQTPTPTPSIMPPKGTITPTATPVVTATVTVTIFPTPTPTRAPKTTPSPTPTNPVTPTPSTTPIPTPIIGPLGFWQMDEQSWVDDCVTFTILDFSGFNHHGTACPSGHGPQPVVGLHGNAGLFDGLEQLANMGPGFNFTSSFTAAMWVALDNYNWCGPVGASQHLIGTHNLPRPSGPGRGWGMYWDCDGIAWELTNNDGSAIGSYGYAQPDPFPANGSWHHAALVYDAATPSATLYWDGIAIYSENGTADVPSSLFNNGEPLTVNGLPGFTGAGAPGKIDDVKVYARALSASEILAIFNSQ
jgi:hypothetical protein